MVSYAKHKPIKMRIAHYFPPNYSEILKAFPAIKGRPIVFTWGDTIYKPVMAPIEAHLLVHEETHAWQQGKDPKSWWDRYLVDPEFRFEQELEAYQHQYQALLIKYPREIRRKVLNRIAADLAGPIYGDICDKARAKELISHVG